MPWNCLDCLCCGYFGSLQSVLNDISVVWRVFSLPVLEPMTRGRLERIVAVTMSCLHAALAATMATSVVAMTTGSTQLRTGTACKDEEIDGYASNIVKKSVLTLSSEIFFYALTRPADGAWGIMFFCIFCPSYMPLGTGLPSTSSRLCCTINVWTYLHCPHDLLCLYNMYVHYSSDQFTWSVVAK